MSDLTCTGSISPDKTGGWSVNGTYNSHTAWQRDGDTWWLWAGSTNSNTDWYISENKGSGATGAWSSTTTRYSPIGNFTVATAPCTGNPKMAETPNSSSSTSSSKSESSSSSKSESSSSSQSSGVAPELIGYLCCEINGSNTKNHYLPIYSHSTQTYTPSNRDFWGDLVVSPANLVEYGFLSMTINSITYWMHIYMADPSTSCCTNIEGTFRPV